MPHYNHQTSAIIASHQYCLEPGDATVYRFGFFEPHKTQNRVTLNTDHGPLLIHGNPAPVQVGQPMADTPLHDLFTGIGDGTDYIYVWIDNNDGGGVYTWMQRWTILHLDWFAIELNQHRFGKTNIYTLTAILLAISVLLINPSDTIGACKKALEAPELLSHRKDDKAEEKEEEDEDDE